MTSGQSQPWDFTRFAKSLAAFTILWGRSNPLISADLPWFLKSTRTILQSANKKQPVPYLLTYPFFLNSKDQMEECKVETLKMAISRAIIIIIIFSIIPSIQAHQHHEQYRHKIPKGSHRNKIKSSEHPKQYDNTQNCELLNSSSSSANPYPIPIWVGVVSSTPLKYI